MTRMSSLCRAFITWLANGDTIRVFKMIKKEDGTLSFKAAPEDFVQKHKAPILNIGIAETGTHIQKGLNLFPHLFHPPCVLLFFWQEGSS